MIKVVRNAQESIFQLPYYRYFCLCACYLLVCLSTFALDRNRSINQFHHTSWTARDGAPEQIRAIAQTSDGYLWLGTSTGLYRFDGVQFESYVPRSGVNFPSNNIYTLLATPDDGLWIGYWYGGVSFLKGGNLTNYGEAEGLPSGKINKFAKDNEGMIWVAARGGLSRFDGSRWELVGSDWNYPGKIAQTVFVDREGTLWVSAEDTIMFLPKGSRSFQPTGEKTGQVLDIAQAPDGALWMAETSRSVRQLQLPGIDPRLLGPEIRVGSVKILFDREGALWVTSIGDGLRRLPDTERFRGRQIAQFSTDAEIFTEEKGFSANYIFTIFEDREGNIWVGTAKGLDRFRASSVVPVHFPPGYQDFGLAAGDEGEIWTGSSNLGANRILGGIPTRIDLELAVSSIFRDRDGAIWMGGSNSIYRWSGNEFSKLAVPTGLKVLAVSAMFKDRAGALWIYMDQEGAFQFKDGGWTRYGRQSELPRTSPIIGAIDSLDRKWFGYAANELVVIDGEDIRTFSEEDGLAVGDVKAIQERSGRVWIGGTLGVGVLEKDRFRMLTAEGTEALRGVSGIVEDRTGALWLNASRGIIHIPTDEIRLALEQPTHKVRHRIFDFLDGLPGAAQQNRPFPTAVEGSDGRLWFSTSNGVAWIDPQQIPRNNTPPPVAVRSLITEEKIYEPSSSLDLPQGTTSLRIAYTALSLSIPEKVRFRYKLETIDAHWQEVDTRREAFYTNLGPGTYRFQVMASNNDGVWNETGASLEFRILPAFYQTNWFYLLCAAALGCIIWLGYRRHVRQVRMRLALQFEDRLAERTRIAQDLHDTLLQGFLSTSMQLHVADQKLPDDSPAKPQIKRVLEIMRQVIEEGRNAVSGLRSDGRDSVKLEQAFSHISMKFANYNQAAFRVVVEGRSRLLHPILQDEVFRIGHEALVNAYRHANAQNIEVTVEYSDNHLRIAVSDDGRGIDSKVLKSGREGHWGLLGMRERAEKIGAQIKVKSRAGAGTEIELVVPGHIAFETENAARPRGWFSKISARKSKPALSEKEQKK